jgi:hypothetical protein
MLLQNEIAIQCTLEFKKNPTEKHVFCFDKHYDGPLNLHCNSSTLLEKIMGSPMCIQSLQQSIYLPLRFCFG